MTTQQYNLPRIISDGDDTSRLLTLIGKHADGSPLLDSAAAQRVIVMQEKIDGALGQYWSSKSLVTYKRHYDLRDVITLIHELRHAFQDHTLRFAKAAQLGPLDQIIFNRAIEADAFAFSATVAADMLHQGMVKGALINEGLDAMPSGILSRIFGGFARRAHKEGPIETYRRVFDAFINSPLARKYDANWKNNMSPLAWKSAPMFELSTAFRDTTVLPLPGGSSIAFNTIVRRIEQTMDAAYKKQISAKPISP